MVFMQHMSTYGDINNALTIIDDINNIQNSTTAKVRKNIYDIQSFLDTYYDSIDLSAFRKKYIRNHKSWSGYRIGDMFLWTKKYKNDAKGWRFHVNNYPNSIATQYMKKALMRPRRGNILLDVVKDKTNIYKSDNESALIFKQLNETIIIHLRTGDVIDKAPYNIYDILANNYQTYTYYLRSISFYQDIIHQLQMKGKNDHDLRLINTVIIITGFHYGGQHNNDKSVKYIAMIAQYFRSNGYNVSLRINENPDLDFSIMCNAKYFVQSSGGYSRIAAEIAKQQGATIFGYVEYDNEWNIV